MIFKASTPEVEEEDEPTAYDETANDPILFRSRFLQIIFLSKLFFSFQLFWITLINLKQKLADAR